MIKINISSILNSTDIYDYLDESVNDLPISQYSKNLLIELNHSNLSTPNLEAYFLTKASTIVDNSEKINIIDAIDINFSSYEYWSNYMNNNTYPLTIGETTTSTNDDPQAISIWAVVDRVAFDRMTSHLGWGTNWNERDNLIEGAAQISNFVRFAVCGC